MVRNKGTGGSAKPSDRTVGSGTAVWSLEKRNTFTLAPAYPERSFNGEHLAQHWQTGTCHKLTTRTRRGRKPEAAQRRRAAASSLPALLRSRKFIASKVLFLGLKRGQGETAASRVSYPLTLTAALASVSRGPEGENHKCSWKPWERHCPVTWQIFLAFMS